MPYPAHVAILMATHNGASFIEEQVRSLLAQDHADWSLWVSDDRSTDGTRGVIEDIMRACPDRFHSLRVGPGRGSADNFLSLLCDRSIRGDCFALADQDDYWLPHKLSRALEHLAPFREQPALYCGRTTVVSETLQRPRPSPLRRRPPCFRNALVQCIAGGNTMVLNASARDLVAAAGRDVDPASHDWWLYQLISGAGGHVIFDIESATLYRQHGRNQFGTNRSPGARLHRIRHALAGRYGLWNARNIAALTRSADLLTAENREVLARFSGVSGARGAGALVRLVRSGVFRQTRSEGAALWLLSLMGRL